MLFAKASNPSLNFSPPSSGCAADYPLLIYRGTGSFDDFIRTLRSPLKHSWSSSHESSETTAMKNCEQVLNFFFRDHKPDAILDVYRVKNVREEMEDDDLMYHSLERYVVATTL